MSTQLDSSIGFKKETAYGTPVAVDRFVEYLDEDFTWSPTFASSTAARYGSRMARADRRVLVKEESAGSFTMELFTKGMGALLEAALGAGSSSVVSGSAYQQLFVPTSNDFLPSYTVQKGVPLLGGAVSPLTFAGAICSGFELTAGNAAVPQIKFSFTAKSVDTAAAYAVPSYLAGNQLFSFVHGSLRIGGSVVPPTATALATGGTAAADVRDVSLTWDNGLDSNGFYLGGAGKRGRANALGWRTGTGTLTAEYDSNVLRDAYLAQSDIALVLRFQLTTPIVAGVFPTFEVTIPNIRLDGELPKTAGGDVISQSVGFTVLDGGVAPQPIYVAIVTPETAI
ncbi:phage tail tube protein [Herbiconiux sp. VKM Ac-2851]|uniref:phage tail tube protein n=1 Tax=Herbiconiux sp. VKM Ac-2851 TaxID=2739025 RepID=UPI00156446F1|nr:hypothetical protein [Herbiconiux sp. VKM Ac-2851]